MRLLPLTLLAALLCGCSPSPEPSAAVTRPKIILLLRHAEKTTDVNDIHLSPDGAKRADALPGLFQKSASRPDPLPAPDFVFAASRSKHSDRPAETAKPLADALKLPLNTAFDSDDSPKLAAELLKNSAYAGKTVLVVWRHSNLPALAAALGVADAPAKWDDEVFDRVWAVTFDAEGKAQPLTKRRQALMPGDAKE